MWQSQPDSTYPECLRFLTHSRPPPPGDNTKRPVAFVTSFRCTRTVHTEPPFSCQYNAVWPKTQILHRNSTTSRVPVCMLITTGSWLLISVYIYFSPHIQIEKREECLFCLELNYKYRWNFSPVLLWIPRLFSAQTVWKYSSRLEKNKAGFLQLHLIPQIVLAHT